MCYCLPVQSLRRPVADDAVCLLLRYDRIEEFNVDSKAEYTA